MCISLDEEQMENPNCTAWHRWCADQYLRCQQPEEL